MSFHVTVSKNIDFAEKWVRESRQTLNVKIGKTKPPTDLVWIPADSFGSQDSKKVRH